MNHLLKCLVGLLLISAFASCKSTKQVVQSDGFKNMAPKTKALLWKLEHESFKKPSYLFGTVHVIPNDDFFWPKGTLSAIENTDRMVFEIDMAEMNSMGAQMKLMTKAIMKDGTKISDLLEEQDYNFVKSHFEKMGLPFMMLERLKPAFLTVFASPDMNMNSLQDGSMKSYEMELYTIAKDRKMKSEGLESIEYQISMFDSIPYKIQAQELVKALKDGEGAESELDKLIALYKDQDLMGFEALFNQAEVMGDTDLLLNNRNANWMAPMLKLARKEACFFAVGAGHLVGAKGVISLLRNRGIKVTPVSHEQ